METRGNVGRLFRYLAIGLAPALLVAGCSESRYQAENKVPELTFEGDVVPGGQVTMVLDGLGGRGGHKVDIAFGEAEGKTVDATFTNVVIPKKGILRHELILPTQWTPGRHSIRVTDSAERNVVYASTTFEVAPRPARP
jgi:hypothetical protein